MVNLYYILSIEIHDVKVFHDYW